MRTLALIIAGILIPYIMAAFSLWEIDPGNWGFPSRLIVSIFSFSCGIMGYERGKDLEEYENKRRNRKAG
jgi:hypothetical protein